MINLLLNLLWINLIIVMVHEAGFFETIDEIISSKWKFYHLPYIFMCATCQVFWLSLLYIIIAGPFNLLTIALCLLNAHLTKITTPLLRLLENIGLKIICLLNGWLGL